MTENPDNFYTFSAAELTETKADYSQLLADKHMHNRQFKKRDRFFSGALIVGVIAILLDLPDSWIALQVMWSVLKLLIKGMDLSPLSVSIRRIGLATFIYGMCSPLIVVLIVAIMALLKRLKHFDQFLLARFPTKTSHFDSMPAANSALDDLKIRQMIKLPSYLIVWLAAKEAHTTASCWIIRKADQPGLYEKLPTTYYNHLLKNPRTRRWADYWLIDGTQKDD
ncbi:MAG: hypothetical protein ABF899_00480 [Oenococcus sp.]|uniref:hypothetical protein n=1 Tax=Oenococcus sp. TaxID=1979414 RepID=UPI0039ECB595